MFDRIIQLLMLAVAATSLIITLQPPPSPSPVPRTLYGVVSRKPRNFRQPINMACLALGR